VKSIGIFTLSFVDLQIPVAGIFCGLLAASDGGCLDVLWVSKHG
jgi:hypothetical protein